MPRSVLQHLAGWGLYPTEPCRVYRPAKLREVRQLLNGCDGSTYISRGLGRSYGDAALNRQDAGGGGGVILHDQLDRLIAFDPQTNVLEAEAGLSFDTIIDVFLRRGVFCPVTPGTKYVTLGGAIAADVHGKNQHRDGSIGSFIIDFKLLTASGEVLTCSRRQNPDVFWATIGGMGLTGVIRSARLRMLPVESAYLTIEYRRLANLDDLLDRLSEDDDRYRYSVAWIDCLAGGKSLGRSILMRGDHTPVADLSADLRNDPFAVPTRRKLAVPFFLPRFVLNPLSVKAFNALYYARASGGGDKTAVVDYDSFFYPLDSIMNWNRMYGKRGFLQYQAALPPQSSRAGLIQLLEKLVASKRASFLAVLKTFGPGNDGLLSFPMAGHTLSLDLANTGGELFGLLDELDRIVVEHGGRVYLAKDARMTRQTFEAMYPNTDAFGQVKSKVDPNGLFSSSLGRRLGLAPGPMERSG